MTKIFQTIVFLLVAPLILVGVAAWTVILRLVLALRSGGRKVVSSSRLPATIYTPEPHNWDTPLPIWALSPPRTVWDPVYLQTQDPRYGERSPDQTSSEQQDTLSLSSKYAGERMSEEEEEESRHTVEVRSVLEVRFTFPTFSSYQRTPRTSISRASDEAERGVLPTKSCHMSEVNNANKNI